MKQNGMRHGRHGVLPRKVMIAAATCFALLATGPALASTGQDWQPQISEKILVLPQKHLAARPWQLLRPPKIPQDEYAADSLEMIVLLEDFRRQCHHQAMLEALLRTIDRRILLRGPHQRRLVPPFHDPTSALEATH